MAQTKPSPEMELSSDPDNVPPRSRLFLVVPKLSDTKQIQVRPHNYTTIAPTPGVLKTHFLTACCEPHVNAKGVVTHCSNLPSQSHARHAVENGPHGLQIIQNNMNFQQQLFPS